MICRVWRGWTTSENAPSYDAVVRGDVIPEIEARRIPGFVSIDLLRRPVPEGFEFATIMWFDDIDAVKAFVGEDYEVAHVPRRARDGPLPLRRNVGALRAAGASRSASARGGERRWTSSPTVTDSNAFLCEISEASSPGPPVSGRRSCRSVWLNTRRSGYELQQTSRSRPRRRERDVFANRFERPRSEADAEPAAGAARHRDAERGCAGRKPSLGRGGAGLPTAERGLSAGEIRVAGL